MTSAVSKGAPWPGAIAVSGGGDSIALMVLVAQWAKERKKTAPVVLTVDHGFRPSSGREGKHVVARAKAHGLAGHLLTWRGAKPASDLEARAREARYGLMGSWCRAHDVSGLYVAHTLEDQAETFLLRLARGSGVDGLAGMRAVAPFPVQGFDGMSLIRPLLEFRRRDLRDFLKQQAEDWIEDPMNADPAFARVRVRTAWPAMEQLGLTPLRIAAAATHLARAREALELDVKAFLDSACRFEDGRARLDGKRLAAAPPEIGLRVLASVLMRVAGADYRPRFERLERLYDQLAQGRMKSARTLHGCRIAPAPKRTAEFGSHTLLICRELAASRKGTQNKICPNSAEN